MAGAGSNWLSGVNVVLVMAYGSLVRAGGAGRGGLACPGVSCEPDRARPCSPREADAGSSVEIPWARARGVDKAPARRVPDWLCGAPRSRARGPRGAGAPVGSWGWWGGERT